MASFANNDDAPGAAPPAYVPVRGRHIWVDRGAYSHHGIDRGDGTVVDFSGAGEAGKAAGRIRIVTVDEFAAGDPIQVRPYGWSHPPDVVVQRAESMLDSAGYRLLTNNCEHFATWCMTGSRHSTQAHIVIAAAVSTAAHQYGPQLVTRAVANGGSATSSGAARTMSGLKARGGTAVGGVALAAATGAVAGAGAISFALKDHDYETFEERDAKRVGRAVGIGAGAVAAGGIYTAVGPMGTPGLSAAGISSGLAALGGSGGMAAGLAYAVSAPVLAALLLGLIASAVKRIWDGRRPEPPAVLTVG